MDKPLHVEGYKLAGMNNIFLFVELQTTWDVVEVRPKRSHVLVGEVVRGKFMACLIFTKEEPHPDLQAALMPIAKDGEAGEFEPCTIPPLSPELIFGDRRKI